MVLDSRPSDRFSSTSETAASATPRLDSTDVLRSGAYGDLERLAPPSLAGQPASLLDLAPRCESARRLLERALEHFGVVPSAVLAVVHDLEVAEHLLWFARAHARLIQAGVQPAAGTAGPGRWPHIVERLRTPARAATARRRPRSRAARALAARLEAEGRLDDDAWRVIRGLDAAHHVRSLTRARARVLACHW